MSTLEQQKQQLKSKIEAEIFKLTNQITEGTFDFVNIKTITERKYTDPAQRNLISDVLEMVKTSNKTMLVNNLDTFQKNIDKTIVSFVKELQEELPSAKTTKPTK
jgi:F0F1-type ATP synthase membrane subunit b/b'